MRLWRKLTTCMPAVMMFSSEGLDVFFSRRGKQQFRRVVDAKEKVLS